MRIIKGKDIVSKNWGGGKTSELFIHPEEGNYSSREFNFRLSKATIEIEKSTFTKLPEVKRELMVLNGELNLIHQNKYNKRLRPYESDRFNGSWQTESIGIAEDFNLMMLNNTEGYLQHLSSDNYNSETIETDCDIVAIYCVTGQAKINSDLLKTEDLAIISQPKNQQLIELNQNSNLILVRIWLNN